MYRIVTVSGLSYTGTTTFGKHLASALNWQFISAGQRFREKCEQHGIAITDIPTAMHRQLDEQVQTELTVALDTVFEGRYLGHFGRLYTDILKIRLEANLEVRQARCLAREPGHSDLDWALRYIRFRDASEVKDAKDLYGLDNFLDDDFFHLILMNNHLEDHERAIERVVRLVRANADQNV